MHSTTGFSGKSKSRLLASAGALGLASLALVQAPAAQAATASNPQITLIQNLSGGRCAVRLSSVITGTIDDSGSGLDAVQYDIVDSNGNSFSLSPQGVSETVGSSNTRFADVSFSLTAPADNYFMVVRDTATFSSTTPLPGPVLVSVPIPSSSLTAAGGACAQYVPANSSPVIFAGADQTFADGGTTYVISDATASDVDNDPLTYEWSIFGTGGAGGFTIQDPNVLNPTINVPPRVGQARLVQLRLRVNDGSNPPVDDFVTLSVPANVEPIADAGADQDAVRGAVVTLDASGSTDSENDPLTYSWTQLSGPNVTISDPNAINPTITVPSVALPNDVLRFGLQVNDGIDDSSISQVRVTVLNAGPNSDAGPDIAVGGGASVTLDGSGSNDPDGDPLSYSWVQATGTSVSLNGASSVQPTFTAPQSTGQQQILEFDLVVDDGFDQSLADRVTVVVLPNNAPSVNAGPDQNVAGGDTVSLAGTATDQDNDQLTITWAQTSGTNVALSSTSSLNPTFNAPPRGINDQVLTFELSADDGTIVSTDQLIITVAGNEAPNVVAVAQPTSAGGSAVFTLDGSGTTDPEGDAIIYQWTQIAGPNGTIADPASAVTTFTAPQGGAGSQTLSFELRATDTFDESNFETVSVTLLPNSAPVADAGSAQSVSGGVSVTLDGSGSSDGDGDPITYSWTQTGGPSVTLAGANTAQPSFTAPATAFAAQTLEFALEVSDGVASDVATVEVVVAANQAPVADISGPSGDQPGGSTITLDGSGSTDPEGQALFYSWTQVSGPTVTISNAGTAQASFVAPAATGSVQTLEFQLLVADPLDASDTETFTVTIGANQPPVANAGPAQGPVNGGDTITLDGSGSTDPDGDALTYSWAQTSGTPVTLSDASAEQPTFTAPNTNETLTFRLTVSDGQESASASVDIAVQAIGSITLIQRVTGDDTSVAFTSNLAGLNTTLATSNGVAQISLASVVAGTYTVTAQDLTAQGYAITDITCDDPDSSANVAARTATIELGSGDDVTCTFSTVSSRQAAVQAIYTFLTGRNALILAHQPDLQRRLDRLSEFGSGGNGSVNAYGVPVPGSEHLPVQASIGNEQAQFRSSLGMALGGGTDQVFDIWAEAYFSRATIGSQKADFNIFHLGADVKLADSLLVGAIYQRDEFGDRGTLEAGEAEGDGWMVGPYVTARLAPQLYAEARAAWGSSDNRVAPFAGIVDAFDTSRSLYSGSLFGELELDEKTMLRPELTLRYLQEKQKAYTDSFGVPIPAQTVDQGDISFRPRLSHVVELEDGWALRPFAEVEGIYTFGTAPDAAIANLLPANVADIFGDFRARVEGGMDLFSTSSFRASASAFYDGIGANNFSNKGIHIGVSFGF